MRELISLMSNESLRALARYDLLTLHSLKTVARLDAIAARKELARRDMAVTFAA